MNLAKSPPAAAGGLLCYHTAMRRLIWFLIFSAGIWLGLKYVPVETKHKVMASIGVERFLRETAPKYLRQKLSIPEDPISKRKKILDEVSVKIEAAQLELEQLAPSDVKGASKAVPTKLVQEKSQAIGDILAETQVIIGDLQELNPQGGILQEAAERLLNKVLPLPVLGGANAQDAGTGGQNQCQCQ